MNNLDKYTMNDTPVPTQSMFTTIYYYKLGRVVGMRETVEGAYVYYDMLGVKKAIVRETVIDYSVREVVVAEDDFKAAVCEYNSKKSKLTSKFLHDLSIGYNLSSKEVNYFYNRFKDNGLQCVIDELDDFTYAQL